MKILKLTVFGLFVSFFGLQEAKAQANPNNAYGDNQIEVEPGVFALYSGDVNQDGFISSDDAVAVDDDNIAGVFGVYTPTDINGDSFVSSDDAVITDTNNINGVFVQKP